MSDKTKEEFEKRKAEIETDEKRVDDALNETIEKIDEMRKKPSIKNNRELQLLCSANEVALFTLKRVNIETHYSEFSMMILEQLHDLVSSRVTILATQLDRAFKETPNEVKELKEKLAQYDPIMQHLKNQIQKKTEELKVIEEQERLNKKRLEKLIGGTYG